MSDVLRKSPITVLWAKKSSANDLLWLPLTAHMSDSVEAMARLWDSWLAKGVALQIQNGISSYGKPITAEFARKIILFLAAAHDLGKASPVFQSKKIRFDISDGELDRQLCQLIKETGYGLEDDYRGHKETYHSLVSHAILKRCGLDESIAVVVGGHHGKPPSRKELKDLSVYKKACGFDVKQKEWRDAQQLLFEYALDLADLACDNVNNLKLSRPVQALVTGLVILTDWIVSDENLFSLIELEECRVNSKQRTEKAFRKLDLPDYWKPNLIPELIYKKRFKIETPRGVQTSVLSAAQNVETPGIMIIEAPMGEGKTEAALVAAEVFASKVKRRGIYFALPTQATSNAMFERIVKWLEKFDTSDKTYSIRLCHSKADLSETYSAIKLSERISVNGDPDVNVFVHEWLIGRKKSLLSDFAIGTVDHVLMAGLKQKHLALRHLGLANKIIIIDEAHAYDVYMNSYLDKALQWLGAYKVPVIILSATLPAKRRRELIQAYTNKNADLTEQGIENRHYPLITYSDGDVIKQINVSGTDRPPLTVTVKRARDEELAELLNRELTNGGCAGIIVNTVRRAQEIYIRISEKFGAEKTKLIHSRFIACDRSKTEDELKAQLGPPNTSKRPDKLIVIGTQVLEQSLDFDFDILITDLCPIDLLLQRIGRLHRHNRDMRPDNLKKPVCYILNAGDILERGAKHVYGEYLLSCTRDILPESITLPVDIPVLVAAVYDNETLHKEIKDKFENEQAIRKRNAENFQISSPVCNNETLLSWLDTDIGNSELAGEAAVRDGTDSIEVIVIQNDGKQLRLLPWIYGDIEITRGTPDTDTAKKIAACTVRLPAVFSNTRIIDKTIHELEEIIEEYKDDWYDAPLLQGSLYLILDRNMEATLCGYALRYDKELGLIYEREKADERTGI